MAATGPGAWTRAVVPGLLLACLLGACGGSAPDYRVEVDIGEAIRSLGSDDLEESEAATDRIVALGPDAIPALASALEHEPPAVRLGVIEALEGIDCPAALALVVSAAARDGDAEVRGLAIRTLGVHPVPEAQAVVEAGLADPDAGVRLAAAGACAALCGSPSALDALVALALEDRPLPNAIAARGALIRILTSGEQARAGQVRAAIRARVPAALNGEPETALRAALLASDVGDPSGRAVLAGALRGDTPPLLRLQAVYALGSVGTDADVPVLASLDGQPGLGAYAYDALRRLAERDVASARPALDDWRGPRPPAELPPPPGAR